MKVIFNSENYPTQVRKELGLNEIENFIFSEPPKYVLTFGFFDVLRGTNKSNGKPILKIADCMGIGINVRIIEFDNIIEMFNYIDSISIFRGFEFKVVE